MKWIDAMDLHHWADRRDSQGLLPEVIRRLVYATVDAPRRVSFPSHEGVQLSGWDGYVETLVGNQFVPDGISCWELGATSQPKGKADDEYDKRTDDPLGVDTATATFIFVTPRRWAGKVTWQQERQALARWKDVRAYDADDLESWLMQGPGVGAWLAVAMNKYPEHVSSLDDFWQEYIHLTNPPFTPGLLVAGREAAVTQVEKWLNATARATVLHVRADTPTEATAFLAACILRLPSEQQDTIRYRTLIADNLETVRALSVLRDPLTIVYRGDDTTRVVAATQRGHRVFLPLGQAAGRVTDQVLLRRQPPDAFARALVDAGLSEEKAWAIVRETGRSISALQRRLATVANPLPLWARPPIAHDLVPIMLVGSWDDQNEADQNVITQLAGKPYEEISRIAASWSQGSDAPLRQAGSTWDFVAPRDAWDQLGRYVTRHDLSGFTNAVERVFSLSDPRLDLPPEERWMAAVRNKQPLHSTELRQGLARSLILLSVLGEEGAIGGRPQDAVRYVVGQILSAQAGWQRWYSVAPELTLLAEAAPEEFLVALNEHLRPGAPEFINIFREEGGVFGSSNHTHLLWALEMLAWQPQYLGSVTLALGRLASLDPGGKLQNRPSRSLRSIFLVAHPNTMASLTQRLQAIDLLLNREPTVGWNLLCDLLPKSFDSGDDTVQPQWRLTVTPHAVTRAEHYQGAVEILRRTLVEADMEGARLAQLVNESTRWTPEERDAYLSQLRQFAQTDAHAAERVTLWAALRGFVNRHRSFSDADWALPTAALQPYAELIDVLAPADPVVRYQWLFDDWWPAFVRPPGAGDTDEALATERQMALETILRALGTDGIVALGRKVKFPGAVGLTLAEIITTLSEQQAFLLLMLKSDDRCDHLVGRGFAARCYERDAEVWLADILVSPLIEDGRAAATLLVGLPSTRATWDRAHNLGPEVERLYWQDAHVWFTHTASPEDIQAAVEHVLDAGRAFVALEQCAHHAGRLPGELLVRVLDAVLASVAAGSALPQGYEFIYALEEVFIALRSSTVDETDVARREWAYLPFLKHSHRSRPLLLHRALSREPALFREVICFAFRARHRDQQETASDEDRARARVADECLSEWRAIPGTDDAGNLDAAALNAWIDEARRLCEESDRAAIGDWQIGRVLAFSGAGVDGNWPRPEICALIERIASEELEQGFSITVFNQRGASFRSLTDGGARERGLAAQYRQYANTVAITAPRAAAVLRGIADRYEFHGHREDVRAEQRDLG